MILLVIIYHDKNGDIRIGLGRNSNATCGYLVHLNQSHNT